MPIKIERREFVKRAAYAAPVILTLKAMPAFAAAGSGKHKTGRGETQGKGLPTDPNTSGNAGTGKAGNERPHRDSGDKNEFERRRHP